METATIRDFRPVSLPSKGANAETGKWRMVRPVRNADKCIGCLLCWAFCPDGVINKETIAIDYQYCKGCGICAHECPVKAIDLVKEEEA